MTITANKIPTLRVSATRRAVLLGGALMAGSLATSLRAAASSPPPDLADRVAPLLPSVVSIRTVIESPTGRQSVVGSGFIITQSGVVATNQHVVVGGSEITVTISGMDPLRAKPLYVAEYLDFALLKVDADKPLPAVTLGDSDKVRVGDTVMLLGNPLGVGESLSVGVISALGRDIGDGRFDRFFQTDAAINHGNSGGAMFDLQGQVVGINSAIYSSPGNTGSIGIGFAMPINNVKLVLDQYQSNGKVVIGSTGVRAQHMTPELAAAFGMSTTAGSIVTAVLPGGTADGKLRPGDIMLKIGSQDATDTSALARLVVQSVPGTTYPVTFLRDEAIHTVTVTIGREEIDPLKALARPAVASSDAAWFMKPSDPGFELTAIGPAERKRFLLDDRTDGVVVTRADPRAAASRAIEAGDVIISINGHPIRQPVDVEHELRTLGAANRTSAALLVKGERGTRWVALPLQEDQ
jgi:serine protease Do